MNRNALRGGILVLDAVLGVKDIGCELSKMGTFGAAIGVCLKLRGEI